MAADMMVQDEGQLDVSSFIPLTIMTNGNQKREVRAVCSVAGFAIKLYLFG